METLSTLLGFIGARRWLQLALGGIAIALLAFTLAKCTGRNDAAVKQAEQTTRSGEAISAAAGDAIARYGNSAANEAAAARAVDQTNKDIAHAKTRDAQRRALLDRLCQEPGRRDDPACKLRRTDPAGMEGRR